MKTLKLTYADLAICGFVGAVIAGLFVPMILSPSSAAIRRDYCECFGQMERALTVLRIERRDVEADVRGPWRPMIGRALAQCSIPDVIDITGDRDSHCQTMRSMMYASGHVGMLLGGTSPEVLAEFDRPFDLALHVYVDLGCSDAP